MPPEVFYRAIGLPGYWVVDVRESRGGGIEVMVEPPRESLRYHRARLSRRVHVRERKLRSWQDTPFAGKSVQIVMHAPRVHYLTCGAKSWHQPKFARAQKPYFRNLEKFVCGWFLRVTIQEVDETCGLSWDTVSGVDQRRLKR